MPQLNTYQASSAIQMELYYVCLNGNRTSRGKFRRQRKTYCYHHQGSHGNCHQHRYGIATLIMVRSKAGSVYRALSAIRMEFYYVFLKNNDQGLRRISDDALAWKKLSGPSFICHPNGIVLKVLNQKPRSRKKSTSSSSSAMEMETEIAISTSSLSLSMMKMETGTKTDQNGAK